MHWNAMVEMRRILDEIKGNDFSVLDVGSIDVNGSYRKYIEDKGWKYTGLDIAPGPNVDMVAIDPYRFPVVDEEYDLVIAGSTMEHVQSIWKWVPELARVTKIDGRIVVLTHTSWVVHRHPVDCWRIMPDGMEHLFNECGNLTDYNINMYNSSDISAVARRFRK